MRWHTACAWVWLAAAPAHASHQKNLEHRMEAVHLAESLASGGNAERDLARVKFIGEEDFVSLELCKVLEKSADERQREAISYALSILGSRTSEAALLKLLGDEDVGVRINAAQGLGRISTKNWHALAPLLKDKSDGVRAAAAKAMGATRVAKAGPLLLSAARIEGEPEVRGTLLTAVGDSGDKALAPGLAAFLSSSSEETRVGAGRGLCRLGAPQGFAFARKLLDSPDKLERRRGLDLLEGASARVVGPLLRPMLKDPNPGIAAKAARILYQGGERVMLDWLVLASFHAKQEDKDAYERELELLQLPDDERKAILARAGVQ